MSSLADLINEYQDVAVSPRDLRNLAAIAVKDASVQDNAVGSAIANAMGVENTSRSALEKYLLAAEEQANGESREAVERAEKRLAQIEQSLSLYGTAAMQTREGRADAARLRAEREQILAKFPQLGFSNGVGGDESVALPEEFNIGKWLSRKDYSPVSVKRLFDEGTSEDIDEAIRTGDLDLYQAIMDYKLGSLPDGVAEKMQFVVGGMPEKSRDLKLNDKYPRLRSVLAETQGDVKGKADDEAKAKARTRAAKIYADKKKEANLVKDQFLNANNDFQRETLKTQENIAKLKWLKANKELSAEDINRLTPIVGEL